MHEAEAATWLEGPAAALLPDYTSASRLRLLELTPPWPGSQGRDSFVSLEEAGTDQRREKKEAVQCRTRGDSSNRAT